MITTTTTTESAAATMTQLDNNGNGEGEWSNKVLIQARLVSCLAFLGAHSSSRCWEAHAITSSMKQSENKDIIWMCNVNLECNEEGNGCSKCCPSCSQPMRKQAQCGHNACKTMMARMLLSSPRQLNLSFLLSQ